MKRTLINISNRLPVTIGQDGQIDRSSGGVVTALEGLPDDQYDVRWIGWPGGPVDEARQAEVEAQLRREFSATPVFMSDEEATGFYEGFANSSLWPLLHYMPSRFRYEAKWWDLYREVNQRFCDVVARSADDDAVVWVHDYQLMLVPRLLKAARPKLRVGFFLHTPFPSYEVFRCHPRREELIEGLLGADQIGFHTFNYMRHFRSAVLRLLGVEPEFNRVRRAGHDAYLGVYPIGINARRFDEELSTPDHVRRVREFAETHQGKQLVLSVERLDYTKGILHRLDAIELFLQSASQDERDAVKFMFISVPSREGVEEYQDLGAEVEERVGHLNGKFATLHDSPIRFIRGSVEFADLVALYAQADVGVVTPLMDGMNLVAKEYVAAQKEDAASGHRPGVLILSEFAGAAEELFNAIIVNPYDAAAVADAIRQALAMPSAERAWRMRPMRERVMRYDAQRWAGSFIDDLVNRPAPVAAPAPPDAADAAGAQTLLADALRAGQRVALFLDYDGTLRELVREPSLAAPDAQLHLLLGKLSDAPNLDVTIISGRRSEDLESFLGKYPFGLIAEHGAVIRRPKTRHWERLDRDVTYAWRDELLKLLRQFEDSTPGSTLEEKPSTIVWHYRRADPEFGEWRAKQLLEELAVLTANDPVQVRRGHKIVEVAPAAISKGVAVRNILTESPHDYAVALLAGDDATDESMFRMARESPTTNKAQALLTIRIGTEGDTAAQYRLPTPAAFRKFLLGALGAPSST